MSDEIRQCIIDKASKLFFQYGIRSITMDFIALELGISKRTLYETFTNKDALIISCLEKVRKEQEADMCAIFNSEANIIEKLVRCYSKIIYYVNQTSRSFQLDIEQMRSKVNEEVAKNREKQFEYIRNILHVGVEEGYIRSDLNMDIVTILHNSQIDWFRKSQTPGNEEWSFAEVLSTVMRIFLYGIVTEKGVKVLNENYDLITQTL